MTTKQNPNLVDLKLAVINYHKGDEFEYLRKQCATDACYTSFNSMQWKQKQMADLKAEIVELHTASGTEVVDVKIERKVMLYQSMECELDELSYRHDADKEVYTIITQGETWMPRPKRTHKSDGLGISAELKRILAA